MAARRRRADRGARGGLSRPVVPIIHRPLVRGPAAAGAGQETPPAPSWRRALVLLWLGQVISHLGDSLFMVGIFFLALEVTGSKAAAALLLALNFLPALALGLFAGALVDRHDRRRVMLAADLLRAGAVGAIALFAHFDRLSPTVLGVCMFLIATGTALFNPALKAIVPELAPPTHLTSAAALFQVSEFAALVLGPTLAGLFIIPALGSIHLFTIDAATFGVSGLCVLALLPIARRPAHADGAQARGGVWRQVVDGLQTMLATPLVRPLFLLVAVDNVLLTGLLHVATPLLVKEGLGLGPEAYARTQSFFFLGLLVGSGAFWLLGRRAPRGITILVGILLDGLTFLPLAFCQTLGQVQLALFVHALALPLIIIPRTVLVQRLVPGPLHGRAFALLHVTVFGMTAISAGLTGVLSEYLPPRSLFLLFGALGALAGLAGLLARGLRRAR
jgi:MFS transporter, DHA3 family, macrolide efflux protein